ncbi:MAG TPA: hypothetical protein PK867_19980 [Pirellulales bacterium]|nr:hypothetical protein [Pirellulales bacterium]
MTERAELSQRILNELAAARVCLLNAQDKAAYDAQVRRGLARPQPVIGDYPQRPAAIQPLRSRKIGSRPRQSRALVIGSVALVAVVLTFAALYGTRSFRASKAINSDSSSPPPAEPAAAPTPTPISEPASTPPTPLVPTPAPAPAVPPAGPPPAISPPPSPPASPADANGASNAQRLPVGPRDSLRKALAAKVKLNAPYPAPEGGTSDRISVQYAVIEVVQQAGLRYDFKTSFRNTDPLR